MAEGARLGKSGAKVFCAGGTANPVAPRQEGLLTCLGAILAPVWLELGGQDATFGETKVRQVLGASTVF